MGDQTFGSTLRKRRDVLGLSQSRLAELVGRSASTVRNWERDRATPSAPADVVALAAILGVDEATLLEQAGFEPSRVETSPTMEQALASLIPEVELPYPVPDEAPPSDPTDSADPVEADLLPEPEPSVEAPGPPAATEADATDAVPIHPTPPPEDAGPPEEFNAPGEGPALAASSPAEHEPEAAEQESALPAGDLLDAGAPPSHEWSTAQTDVPRSERRRRTERAAPPTVLESAPVGEPSYLEDPEERQRYRVRALTTTAVVVILAILLLWAFDRTTDVLGDMWQQFLDMLTI